MSNWTQAMGDEFFKIVGHKRDVSQRMNQKIIIKPTASCILIIKNQKATNKW